MRAEDHIIAWIESSRPHYDRLLEIERRRQPGALGDFRRKRRDDAKRQILEIVPKARFYR